VDFPSDTLAANESTAPARGMLFVCALLLVYAGALAWLGRSFTSASMDAEAAAFWLVSFSVPAALVYLFELRSSTPKSPTKMAIPWIIATGFAMRAIVMTAPPSLEDDYYRYLWDGAVTAHRLNPYHYSPTQVLWGSIGAEPVPPAFMQLAEEAGPILERINHPDLTTIYPPIAQRSFAMAHWFTPWSTDSWRCVLLLADVVTLKILLRLLSVLGLPSMAIAWYWWNPLLLRETYGGAHMDVLTLPFVMGAVLLATKKRFTLSMLVLALAGGVKLWPIMLVPILLRPTFATPKRLFLALGVFLATTALVWSPAVSRAFGANSGFLAYAASWQYNAGAFALLEGLCRHVLARIGHQHVQWAGPLARGVVGAVLLAWVVWLIRKPVIDDRDVSRRCCLALAALFLLAPAQFPWYFVWLLPFLTIAPSVALLSYSLLLPLYYVHLWHPAIAWLEHGAVWLLLAREIATGRIAQRRVRPVGSLPCLEQGP